MTAFDIKVLVSVFLCFVFGLVGAAVTYLWLDEAHSAFDKLEHFSGAITALISVTGAIVAAGLAFASVKEKIEFDRKLVKQGAVTQGDVIMREAYHRLSDLHWFVVEIRGAVDRFPDRLPEQLSEELFDAPRRASLRRLQEFAHGGWARLEKVHSSQRRDLAYYISGIETGCENIYGLADRADVLKKRSERNQNTQSLVAYREAYMKTVARCLADLEPDVKQLCIDYTALNPGRDFDHVSTANYS